MQNSPKSTLLKIALSLYSQEIPFIPLNGKIPVIKGWQKHCETLPTKEQKKIYLSKINDSIGLPLGPCSGVIAIDIDTTDKKELSIITKILPTSPIVKVGKKGETRFYKYDGETPKKIKRGNRMIIELLSTGNQTVLPPSIHPETQNPYRYTSKHRIENFDLSKLPSLPTGILDKIDRAISKGNSTVSNNALMATSRNDQLKSMVVAMLHEGKKDSDTIANDILDYDLRNHKPALFKDKKEPICKSDPFSNALQFVANIRTSITKEGDTLPSTKSHLNSISTDIEVLTLGEFLEPDRFPPRIPVVEGLMNQQELHLCSAPAKAGKTILQINLAIAVARGESFLGTFKTHKGKVLIIQTEVAATNFQSRLNQVTNTDIDDIGDLIFISSNRVKLDTEEGLEKLEQIIKRCDPKLIILDPFYTLHDSDEDRSSEIAPVLTNLREVIIRSNTTCLLIHHQGKGVANNNQVGHKHRGSSSLADVPDGSWSLNKSQDNQKATLSFELRNHQSPLPMRLTLGKDLRWLSDGFTDIESTALTVQIVKEESSTLGEVTSKELVDHLMAKFQLSKKTVQNKIKDAVRAKALHFRKDGRNKFYTSALEQVPRDINDPKEPY